MARLAEGNNAITTATGCVSRIAPEINAGTFEFEGRQYTFRDMVVWMDEEAVRSTRGRRRGRRKRNESSPGALAMPLSGVQCPRVAQGWSLGLFDLRALHETGDRGSLVIRRRESGCWSGFERRGVQDGRSRHPLSPNPPPRPRQLRPCGITSPTRQLTREISSLTKGTRICNYRL
jgi:hypothetical protein